MTAIKTISKTKTNSFADATVAFAEKVSKNTAVLHKALDDVRLIRSFNRHGIHREKILLFRTNSSCHANNSEQT